MKSETWFGKLWARFRAGVIQDVPPGLEECESCRENDCTQARWETCEKRLATEAASLQHNGPSKVRTGELLPRVPINVRSPAAEVVEPRERKISNH
jgi:hypothetical protein